MIDEKVMPYTKDNEIDYISNSYGQGFQSHRPQVVAVAKVISGVRYLMQKSPASNEAGLFCLQKIPAAK